jgi:hypothetical protein
LIFIYDPDHHTPRSRFPTKVTDPGLKTEACTVNSHEGSMPRFLPLTTEEMD